MDVVLVSNSVSVSWLMREEGGSEVWLSKARGRLPRDRSRFGRHGVVADSEDGDGPYVVMICAPACVRKMVATAVYVGRLSVPLLEAVFGNGLPMVDAAPRDGVLAPPGFCQCSLCCGVGIWLCYTMSRGGFSSGTECECNVDDLVCDACRRSRRKMFVFCPPREWQDLGAALRLRVTRMVVQQCHEEEEEIVHI
jgi:hypothetical protein